VSFFIDTVSPNPQTFTFYPDDPLSPSPNPATMTTSVPDMGTNIAGSPSVGLPPAVQPEAAQLLDEILNALGFQITGADIGSPQGGLDCGNSILVQ
jgi:hypothetical protein